MAIWSKVNWSKVNGWLKPIALASLVLAVGVELGIYAARHGANSDSAGTPPVRVETMKPIVPDADTEFNKAQRIYEQRVEAERMKLIQRAVQNKKAIDERNRHDEHSGTEAEPKASD